MKDVVIVGGGLAGLVNGILLSRAGFSVQLFEEKKYPFHRVCGEYISNEVVPFLKRHDLYPEELQPASITQFQLSSISGNSLNMPLDLGGFGIGRNTFDLWLADKAMKSGVEIIHRRIIACDFKESHFKLLDKMGESHSARLVIGAFGKRSMLDKNLSRPFMEKRHPYIGVKYHIRTEEVSDNVVALHNFPGGYCGVNKVDGENFNLCYLSRRENLKKFGSIPEMERQILQQNPHLKRVFQHSDFIFETPEVINEITFEKKEPVYNHILMTGDSAGMITPLCGNGMAMAIHSAYLLSSMIISQEKQGFNREVLERDYERQWNQLFASRLWMGRKIQKLFGAPFASGIAVSAGKVSRPFANFLMKQTHGSPFS